MKRTFFRLLRGLMTLSASVVMLIVSAAASHAQGQRAPAPMLTVDDVSIVEGHEGYTMLTFTFQLSYAEHTGVSFKIDTTDDTAIHGEDYLGTIDTMTIPAGQASVTRLLHIIGDTNYEDDEIGVLYFYDVEGAYSHDSKAAFTIQNDDPRPAETYITVDDPQVNEGSRYTTMNFTFTRSGELERWTSVQAATKDGTATHNVDYHPWNNVFIQFPPGVTTATLQVVIIGDRDIEPDETLFLNLTTSDSYTTLLKLQGVGTILNDDTGVFPSVSISDAEIIEGDSGSGVMTFTLTRTPADDEYAEISIAVVEQTALRFHDYRSSEDDFVSFHPGETVKQFSVEILGDTVYEPDETFLVELHSPWKLTIADGQAVGTILNDDPSFAVTHFSLIDAATDTVLIEDFEGGTVELAALGGAKKLTIQAHVFGDQIGSVRFALNDKPKFRTDNKAPFTLGKNKGRNLKPWPYKVGKTYTLTAAPFSGKKASGEAGSSETITFIIVKSSSTGSDAAIIPTITEASGDTRLLAVPPAP